MADAAPFSETFQQRFHPRNADGVTVLSVRGRLTAEQFEDLRLEVEAACRAGWRGVVCDVQSIGDDADIDDQLMHLVQCYTALARAGVVFNFLHAARFIGPWRNPVMTPRPPAFETEDEAVADVRTRCAASR